MRFARCDRAWRALCAAMTTLGVGVQVVEKHDVREAIDILVKDGGERWREQVEAWGAVYEEKATKCVRAACWV